MYDEISAAVLFIMRLISRNGNIGSNEAEEFGSRLSYLLTDRYRNHWFPDKPFKGQGYRCIRMNEVDRCDPVLKAAAQQCGLKYEELGLPVELTVWVDPEEVCCRFGEHKGSYCTVASFRVSVVSDKENCDGTRSFVGIGQNVEQNESKKLSLSPCSAVKRCYTTKNALNVVATEPQLFGCVNQVSSRPDYCYFLPQMSNGVKRHVIAPRTRSPSSYSVPPSSSFTDCGENHAFVYANDNYQSSRVNTPLLKA